MAALGLVSAVAALVTYPDIDGVLQGRGWTQAMVWCSAAMLVLCLWQHLSWLRATAVWHGRPQQRPGGRGGGLLDPAARLVRDLADRPGGLRHRLFEVGRFATTAVFLVLSLIVLLAAQVLAGVQYVTTEGPPGTVPAH